MEDHEICCDWCGRQFLYALAVYVSGHGAFYEPECIKEKRQYNEIMTTKDSENELAHTC
jgi:hypothetical protein